MCVCLRVCAFEDCESYEYKMNLKHCQAAMANVGEFVRFKKLIQMFSFRFYCFLLHFIAAYCLFLCI